MQESRSKGDNYFLQIRGTDNLIVAGHVEGDSSTLEVLIGSSHLDPILKLQVYVYNDVEDALYVHHDILLPSFPLALEWLAFDPESDTRGSLVAVGAMNPVIEVGMTRAPITRARAPIPWARAPISRARAPITRVRALIIRVAQTSNTQESEFYLSSIALLIHKISG